MQQTTIYAMEQSTPYIVSARKYRPSSFASVVGQEALTSTLKNAIDSNRLAQAYLFCGPRGVGKTSCARIFAKTINCLNPTPEGEACGECESCRAMEQGNSFNVIELDAASNNSVEDIRNLTDQVNVPPQVGKYRVFIIDEVHMLSNAAFNAFLKTLEEPPKYVIFILATTEKHKVIPTILSRCQIYDFKRITIPDMVAHLQHVAQSEGISAEMPALNVIARKADGAMRDALSIFDQVAASSRGNITYASAIDSLNVLDYDYYFNLVDAFRAHDVQRALVLYKEIRDKGFDSQFFINGLAGHIRDLMVASTPQTSALLEVADEVAATYMKQAGSLTADWYYRAIELLNDCDLSYKQVTDKRLHVELCLIRLCRIGIPNQAAQAAAPPAATPQQATPAVQQPAKPAPAATAPQQQATPPPPRPAAPPQPRPVAAAATHNPAVRHTVRITATPAAPRPAAIPKPAQPAQAAAAETNAAAEPQATENHLPTGENNNFTQEELMACWKSFMDEHPDKHLLLSAMRQHAPQNIGGGRYKIMADHPGMEQTLTASLPELIGYLRQRLGNDALTLVVEQAKPEERAKMLSPRESLKQAVEKNNTLHALLTSIDAEII